MPLVAHHPPPHHHGEAGYSSISMPSTPTGYRDHHHNRFNLNSRDVEEALHHARMGLMVDRDDERDRERDYFAHHHLSSQHHHSPRYVTTSNGTTPRNSGGGGGGGVRARSPYPPHDRREDRGGGYDHRRERESNRDVIDDLVRRCVSYNCLIPLYCIYPSALIDPASTQNSKLTMLYNDRTNLAVALANNHIHEKSSYSLIHPMMTRDGDFPRDFQQPKTVEAFRLMEGVYIHFLPFRPTPFCRFHSPLPRIVFRTCHS